VTAVNMPRILCLANLILAALGSASAQQLPRPQTTEPAPVQQAQTDPLGRSTPHGSVAGFLRATTAGDYSRAAEFLDWHGSTTSPEDLARELHQVIDQGLPGDLSGLSRNPEGNPRDGLPAGRERLGSVQAGADKLAIELNRVKQPDGSEIWLFSASTLRQVPRIYGQMRVPPLLRYLPQSLSQIRIFSIPLWRWIAIAVGLALALASASWVTRALILLLRPFLRRFTGEENERRLEMLKGPVRLLLIGLVMRVLSAYSISLLTRQLWNNLALVLTVIGSAWLLVRCSDLTSPLISRRLRRENRADKIGVLDLARRLWKILVALAAIAILLNRAGVNVTALLAGLGVGGIALALAAQKTLENVFGGISLIFREAIHVGETCQVAGQTGIVEDIGLGTTRLRTFDRTVISVPNAQLSILNLENMSKRDKCWFHQTFGLRYDTSAEQMRAVLSGIEEILRYDGIEASTARVRFIGFGPSSLTLEIYAYIQEADYAVFLGIQQKLLLAILDTIAAAGASIAAPVLLNEVTAQKNGAHTIKKNFVQAQPK